MGVLRRLGSLWRRTRVDGETDAELRSHIEMRVADNLAAGMSPKAARRDARLRFGNPAVMKERVAAADTALLLDGVWRDLRYGTRQLQKSPGFAMTMILTLALGIGVNTAVFSLLDGFLLRALPYSQPERIAVLITHIEGASPRSGRYVREDDDAMDRATWEALRHNVTAATIAAYGDQFGLSSGVNLDAGAAGDHAVQYVRSSRVSAHYFEVLGIRPYLGRGFSAEEDRAEGPDAVVLSYGLWHTVFHGDEGILGKVVRLKDKSFTVVGVLPWNAVTPNPAQVWVPLRPGDPKGVCGGGDNCGVLMRLKPGASWQQLGSQLSNLPRPDYTGPGFSTHFYAQPLQQYAGSEMRPKVEVLMVAVGLILLIACGNLAGLTLVRISQRTQEIATRLALGASQGSVLRQLWMESLVLAVLGAGAGLCLAEMMLTEMQRVLPMWMIPASGFALDGRVLGFALLASLAASMLFGALPALQTRRVDLRISLASGSRWAPGGARRLRRVLIGAEVALTVVLLAAAGLLVRTLVHLETLPPGFDPHNVMTAKASLDGARYSDAAAFHSLLNESIAAMKRIPGVQDAAVGLSTPYERGLNTPMRILDGTLAGTAEANAVSSTSYVTPDYFRVLRIPLLAGREFTDRDTAASERVAVVNEAFAQKFFHEANAVGRHLQLGETLTIVGVVQDVVKEPGIHPTAPLATEPVFYIPAAQVTEPASWHVWFQPSWIVRTKGPVAGLTAAMQRALVLADPKLPFSGFYSMDDLMNRELQMQRIEVLLMGALAGLALLLSAIGIYALVSNLVVQRTREIGIRMALGSPLSEAMLKIGGSGLSAAGAGIAVGLGLTLLALPVLKSQIYGIETYDLMTLLAVPLVIAVIAGVASLLPSLRIGRIDPAETLRAE